MRRARLLALTLAAGGPILACGPDEAPPEVATSEEALFFGPPPFGSVDRAQTLTDPSATLALGGTSEQVLAQTVTAGRTGWLIGTLIEVGCTRGRIRVEVRGVTAAGEPDGVTQAVGILPGFLTPSTGLAPRFVPLFPARRFEAGEAYALVLSSSGECGIVRPANGDTHPGGSGFFDARPNPVGVWVPLDLGGTPSLPGDLAFETYVFP